METQEITRKQEEEIKQVNPKRDQLTDNRSANQDLRIAVYTVMNSEGQLSGEEIFSDKNWTYICFTDNENVKAEGWEIRKLPSLMDDYDRNAELLKTLPHLFLDDYDISIWIDNSFLSQNDYAAVAEQILENKNIALLNYTGEEIMLPFKGINGSGVKKSSIPDEEKHNKILKRRLVKELKKNRTLMILRRHNNSQVTALMQECWEEMIRHETLSEGFKTLPSKIVSRLPLKYSTVKKMYRFWKKSSDKARADKNISYNEDMTESNSHIKSQIALYYPFTGKPLAVRNIEITTKIGCSNMCSYCPQELLIKEYKKRSSEIYLSMDTFEKCLNKVDKDVKIRFTGMAEPFLNPDCMDMIEFAKRKGHAVYISTTLTGLKIEDIKRLESIDINSFLVHLPSELGDRFPKDEDYREKLSLIINSTITNKSYHHHGERLHPSAEIAKDLVKRKNINSRSGNLDCIDDSLMKGPVTCQRSFAHPVLLPNGDLVLCCMDYGLGLIIGNLGSDTLEDIYSGSKFVDLVKATLKDSGSICHDCEDYGMLL